MTDDRIARAPVAGTLFLVAGAVLLLVFVGNALAPTVPPPEASAGSVVFGMLVLATVFLPVPIVAAGAVALGLRTPPVLRPLGRRAAVVHAILLGALQILAIVLLGVVLAAPPFWRWIALAVVAVPGLIAAIDLVLARIAPAPFRWSLVLVVVGILVAIGGVVAQPDRTTLTVVGIAGAVLVILGGILALARPRYPGPVSRDA